MSELPPVPGPDAPGEPLISVGSTVTLAAAAVSLLVLFGVHISDDAKAQIMTVVGILAPIIVTLIGRMKVFSPKTVRALVTQATKRQ